MLIKLKIYVMIIFPFNDIRTNSLTREAFEIGFMRGSKYRVLAEKMLVFWSLIAWEVFAHTRWPIMRGSNFNWENFDVLDGWSFIGGSNYRTWLAKFWCFGQLVGSITGRFSGYKPPAEIEPRQLERVVRSWVKKQIQFNSLCIQFNDWIL